MKLESPGLAAREQPSGRVYVKQVLALVWLVPKGVVTVTSTTLPGTPGGETSVM